VPALSSNASTDGAGSSSSTLGEGLSKTAATRPKIDPTGSESAATCARRIRLSTKKTRPSRTIGRGIHGKIDTPAPMALMVSMTPAAPTTSSRIADNQVAVVAG
jgi:hypothetical protein